MSLGLKEIDSSLIFYNVMRKEGVGGIIEHIGIISSVYMTKGVPYIIVRASYICDASISLSLWKGFNYQ